MQFFFHLVPDYYQIGTLSQMKYMKILNYLYRKGGELVCLD